MYQEKKGKANILKGKAIWVAGSLVLTVAAFHFIPVVQKKLEDKLYEKMK